MGRNIAAKTREGVLFGVLPGRRVRIDPQLRDKDQNTLSADEVDVSGGFLVVSNQDDPFGPDFGTFDVQNITDAIRDLGWTATYQISQQHRAYAPKQTDLGPDGQNPSPLPPVIILASAAGGGFADPVLDKDLSSPPGAPGVGDRYIVNPPGGGAWVGQDNAIAEWNGATWDFTAAAEGLTTFVVDEGKYYVFSSGTWIPWENTLDHNLFNNLTFPNDAHTQYALLIGRAGGQVLRGGVNASEDLELDSTSHATKGKIVAKSNIVPTVDDQFQVGEAGRRFNTIYTNDLVTGDLNLKSKDAHWTIIEQPDCIIVKNQKNGRTYRMVLEEVKERKEEK